MSLSTLQKLRIFLAATKIIKNWKIFPLSYFGIIKGDPIIILRNNLRIKLRGNSTDLHTFTNIWLLNEYTDFVTHLREDANIIDIGAHIGFFTTYMSQFCNKGKILCFEPVKENYEFLSYNINLNNIKNVELFPMAVTDKSNMVKVFLKNDSAAHNIFEEGAEFVEVKSTSLKDILDSNNLDYDLLKLDCEGAEYLILNALPDSYFERIKKIVMEYHLADKKPELIQNLIKKLEILHYSVITTNKTHGMGLLFASMQDKTLK